MADLRDIWLVINQIDCFIALDKQIDIGLLEFIEGMVGNESDLEEIAKLIEHCFYIAILS